MSDHLTITYGSFGAYRITITQEEQQALLKIMREMISKTTALEKELHDAGQAAGLTDDLMADTFAGFFQVALEDARRLHAGLLHPTPHADEA